MTITKYKILLASNSPRRKDLLKAIDVDFRVETLANVDESYPSDLPVEEVAEFIARKKSLSYIKDLRDEELLITADTVVILNDKIYGKPKNTEDAKAMLRNLSGKVHKVISGVCLRTNNKDKSFSVASEVEFDLLSHEEIDYYTNKYSPLDKAGSYGIQEWIGYIGVKHINGSYYNIMGLPIQRLYREILDF